MFTISKITSTINKIEQEIIANINQIDLDTYNSIQEDFQKGNVNSNSSFQTRFSSFYRLNGAALTPEFKSTYYSIMEKNRNNTDFEDFQIKEIILELFNYENYQGDKCIQFSFTTKLIHTINNDLPIYDSMIKKVFGFKGPHYYNNTNEKIGIYMNQYNSIKETYRQIIKNDMLSSVVTLFNSKFTGYSLGDIKTLDFIFWTAGKIDKVW